MSLFRLCNDDQLVNTLHGVFRANILRIPEARIQPLRVVAAFPHSTHFWGYLTELLSGNFDGEPAVQQSSMADIAGKRSKNINLELGLQILEGFLGGFGLPSAVIASQFSGAKTVSFSFQEVMRYYISPAKLGKLLQGHALDSSNGSNDIFFRKEAILLVIDSVITSMDFSIKVGEATTGSFKLDVPTIQDIVGKANTAIQVESSTGLDITFKGDKPLSFAFTCLRCEVDLAGRIALKPHVKRTSFTQPSFEPELLHASPGMIEWEE